MEIGDAYFGPYICSFPKCILQMAAQGGYAFLDGTVITPGCDSMRRLDECWRKVGQDYPGTLPDFFFFYGVPHKTAPHGLLWFAEETRRLIQAVEAHFAVQVTPERLARAIEDYNQGRRLLGRLEALRSARRTVLTGVEAFAAQIAGTVMPRPEYNRLLEALISGAEGRPSLAEGKKRLMLIGSVADDVGLIRMIEEAGAVVVAESLCFGPRRGGEEVRLTGDPVADLAEFYLSRSVCPRMFGAYRERLTLMRDKIARASVDGVVMQNIRFCDLHGSENGLFERDLEADGVPCLKIEREYGPLVETGRMRMRLDAFLERLA